MNRLTVYSIATLLGFLLLAGVALQMQRCFYENQLADVTRERNNALAEADTLRVVAQDEALGATLFESRAFTLEAKLEDASLMNDMLRERLDETERTARTLSSMYVEARGRIEILSNAIALVDSTEIPIAYRDSVFGVEGRSVFFGKIHPEPNPTVRTNLEISSRIRTLTAISCDEDEASPHVNVFTNDERVSVLELRAEVDEDVACLSAMRGESPFSFDLMPEISPGTAWLVGLSGLFGYMLK